MPDSDNLEKLIKKVYRKYKSGVSGKAEVHPDEEAMACFWEGKLSAEESETIKSHLTKCVECAEAFSIQACLEKTGELEVPPDLIPAIKKALIEGIKDPILEIILKFKESFFELVSTSGDVLVGQELMPAPLLRSRKIKNFKDEVTILKDFDNIRAEIKIENKGESVFTLAILIKEKQSSVPLKDLRVTLSREDSELESYVSDSGKVIFDHVLTGKYTIEISNPEKRLASILLNINV